MTDDASTDDKAAVTFSRGIWPVEPDEEFEPDLARHTVAEPVSTPPWRQVARPPAAPAWPVWPVGPATGSSGSATGPAAMSAWAAGPASTEELRLDLDLDPAPEGPPPDRGYGSQPDRGYGPPDRGFGPPPGGPHGVPPEHPHGPPPDYAYGPSWAKRAWLGLAAAAILVLTVAAGFALSPRHASSPAASAATGVKDAAAARQPVPAAAGGLGSAGTGAAGTAGPTSAPSRPTREPSTVPAPVTVAYEGEAGANKLSGGAFVTNYPGASGGRVVKNIGDWKNAAGPGALTFTDVTVPAGGAYTLVFFYVHANGDPTRTAVITVDGANPIDVTVSGGSACCARQAVDLTLVAGKNTITFGNPRAPAPAIDKIEIVKGTAG